METGSSYEWADYSSVTGMIKGIKILGWLSYERRMFSIGTLLNELHSWEWIGILVARLAVGSLFFLSGRGKLFVPERREQMRQTLIEAHVPFPEFNAVFVSIVEFVCGLLLVLGALTLLACAMLGCAMMIAIPP